MGHKSIVTLALECSAGAASAAVGVDGTVVAQTAMQANHGHAAWMIPIVKQALEQSDYGFDDVTDVLAGRGPGSFTGIRVALAAAKGLGLSLEAKVIGLSSLEAMATAIRSLPQALGRNVITMIDSRRSSIFYQLFTADGAAIEPIQDGDLASITDAINTDEAWVAAGFTAEELADLCPAVIAIDHPFPHAADLIMLYHEHNGDLPADHLEPLYLAPPILGPR